MLLRVHPSVWLSGRSSESADSSRGGSPMSRGYRMTVLVLVLGVVMLAPASGEALKRDGSLAWIASTFNEFGALQPGRQVVKVEHGAGPVLLDSGPGVVAGSLALAGSTLYWTKNGRPFSAPMR